MFTEPFRRVRQKCWDIINREYPEEKDKYAITKELVANAVSDGAVILDAGCGHTSVIPDVSSIRITRIGMDIILEDVRKNKSIDLGLCSNINHIPLKGNTVDIIVCNMVFEHLRNPEAAFAEMHRVLKEGGFLVFMTPCVYNVVTVLSILLPNRLHRKVVSWITTVDENDIFPTFYRANSIGALRKKLGRSNFAEEKLIMYQPPPYAFVFSTALCKLMIRYYRLINRYRRLESLRGVIIARYRKCCQTV